MNHVRSRDRFSRDTKVLFYEWLDEGYVGVTTDKLRANPVYQGKWVQIK